MKITSNVAPNSSFFFAICSVLFCRVHLLMSYASWPLAIDLLLLFFYTSMDQGNFIWRFWFVFRCLATLELGFCNGLCYALWIRMRHREIPQFEESFHSHPGTGRDYTMWKAQVRCMQCELCICACINSRVCSINKPHI